MSIRQTAAAAIVAASLGLAGCAPLREPAALDESRYTQPGVVERIELVDDRGGLPGLLIGGVVGGLIGAQIGGGMGHTVATLVGTLGGAVAGSAIDGRQRREDEAFRVTVRFDDGSHQTFVRDDLAELRPGDRVRMVGGRLVRL